MRKAQKKQVIDFVILLGEAHDELRKVLEKKQYDNALDILKQCQQGAIQLGELIEQFEGDNFPTVSFLEEYCEVVFQIHELVAEGQTVNGNKIYKKLRKMLFRIESSAKNDIKIRMEVAFFPYKASMWDSLESIWKAADSDPDCDVYVVPIPYYDRNPDGSFKMYHYEGMNMPSYVPVTHYEEYSLENRKPDVIFIHNPYDNYNYVTSIDPRFYSGELKKYTDLLVYVPYYCTSGTMSEGQKNCPAYYNSDYLVIQAPQYREFFESDLPDKKFLPLGSPKFDRVIHMCNETNILPDLWKDKAKGKKLYFYNTSIGGMLKDTEKFLKKMEYVFRTFQGKKDACIVWRPHPLLDSTFQSMRTSYYARYVSLKDWFIESELGIYDDTPDITLTIALCDAYIGDAGTSVTSLFGIAGKPLFILDNCIHTKPNKDDWRGKIIKRFNVNFDDEWMVTQGDLLYRAPCNDYKYEYYCSLSEYSHGGYYLGVININGKAYVCPGKAQDMLVVDNMKIEKRISFKACAGNSDAFLDAVNIGSCIYLIPNQYPAIVRYDTSTEQVSYIEDFHDIFIQDINRQKRFSGVCIWKGSLLIASPVSNYILKIDNSGKKTEVLAVDSTKQQGYCTMLSDGTDIWLLPFVGDIIVRWNPDTGETREYSGFPDTFICQDSATGLTCMERPFSRAAFCGKYVYLPPYQGNLYIRLDKDTGEIKKWNPPFPIVDREKNEYYQATSRGCFIRRTDTLGDGTYRFFSQYNRKLYDVNLNTNEYQEIPIEFNLEELQNHEPGFCEVSDGLQYACKENVFNSLNRFLDNNIVGNPFDENRQINAYKSVAANNDGTSGEKIYQFVKSKF